MSESLLLIAVQLVLNQGTATLQGGDKFSSYYSISAIESYNVIPSRMQSFVSVLTDEVESSLSSRVGDQKDCIIGNLEIAAATEAWDDGVAKQTVVNQIYDQDKGKMFLWMYRFAKSGNNVKVEIVSSSVKLSVAATFVVVYHSKASIIGNTTWSENQYIPSVVSSSVATQGLAVSLAPFILNRAHCPSEILKELVAGAKTQNGKGSKSDKLRGVNRAQFSRSISSDLASLICVSTGGAFNVPVSNHNNWEFSY